MCSKPHLHSIKNNIIIFLALFLGILAGMFSFDPLIQIATLIQISFQKMMKLIAVPIIFFSIFSIILKMSGQSNLKRLFKESIFYTFTTTFISALMSLLLIWGLKNHLFIITENNIAPAKAFQSWNWLDQIIPEHALQPFITGNVLSCLILAVLLGISFTKVSNKKRIEEFSEIILEGLMVLASYILKAMPLILFSGITLMINDRQSIKGLKDIIFFVIVVIGANLLQGVIILPLLLKLKKIPIMKTFLGFKDALIYAFFSKSSLATLPIAKRCAEENLGICSTISRFTFPIFTTINMNGCAAFIFTALSLGYLQLQGSLEFFQIILLLFLSVIAAVGNAGVPMGCYFLATALLSALKLDLTLISLVLPIYSIIDMIETALNVWSDAVITTVIDKKMQLISLKNTEANVNS